MLRLWRFRPQGMTSVVDGAIREAVAPAAATSGLRAIYAGRRSTGEPPERILVSVWDSPAALASGAMPDGVLAAESRFGDGRLDSLELALSVDGRRSAEDLPLVLRVFEGSIRDGHVAEYLEAASQGTREDIASGTGPLELHLALGEAGRFVTVSAWTGWAPIEAATGGNIRNPIATRHTAHLVSGTAAHYEIVPGACFIR